MPTHYTTKRSGNYKRLPIGEFIKRAEAKHGKGRYDYSKVSYRRTTDKVIITCNRCGNEFLQSGNDHLEGKGCGVCARESARVKRALTREQFLERAIYIHGDKYDYSRVVYINSATSVEVGCKQCGCSFFPKPTDHLTKKSGCPKCSNRVKRTQEEFVKLAEKIYGDDFDHSMVVYTGSNGIITVKCTKCNGLTTRAAHAHLRGRKCPTCSSVENGKAKCHTREMFVEKATLLYGDKFDYSRVVYKHSQAKVTIICNACKKPFDQQPSSHLSGYGCPHCNKSKGEAAVAQCLDALGICYERERRFDDLKDVSHLRLDFYLPKKKVVIEYHGEQHYTEIAGWGGKHKLDIRIKHDQIKRDWCGKKGIKLIEIPYTCPDIKTFLCEQLELSQLPLTLR